LSGGEKWMIHGQGVQAHGAIACKALGVIRGDRMEPRDFASEGSEHKGGV
jgi:hypothetical protein